MKQTNGKIWKRRTLSLLLALMVSVSSFAPAFAEGEAPAEGMESSSMSAETFEPGSAGTSEEGGSSGTESGSTEGAPVSGGDKNESTDGQAPGEETSEPAPGEGDGGLAPGEDGDKDDPASGEGEGETGTGTASGEEEEPPALDGDGSAGTSAPDAGESIPAEDCPTEGCTLPAGHEGECVVSNGVLQPLADEGVTFEDGTLTVTAADISAVSDQIKNIVSGQSVTKIVVDTTGAIPTGAFKDNAFKNVTEIEIINAGDIETKAFDGVSNSSSITRNITIVKSGDIASQAFYRLNGAGGQLNITECGNIAADAFRYAKLSGEISIDKCGNIEPKAFDSSSANNASYTTLKIGSCGSIGDDAFKGLSSITAAEIGTITGTIEGSVFSYFSNLTSVEIGTCGDIPDNAFEYNSALTTVTIENAGNIGKTVFRSCPKVETLTITSCGDIGSQAFLGMTGLKTVTIGKCGSIGSSAFGSMMSSTGAEPCSSLEEVTLNCESIGDFAFYSAGKNITSLNITGCTSIGLMAFNGLGSADGVESLTLENVEIGDNAFGSAKIKNLVLAGSNSIGSQAFVSATIENLILRDIKSTGSESFAYLKGLQSLTVENMDEIGDSMFKLEGKDMNAVTTITLNNVKRIGSEAFSNFSALETVEITGNCEYIGAHAFNNCTNLKNFTINGKSNIYETGKEIRLGYNNVFVGLTGMLDRVKEILSGGFNLDLDPLGTLDELKPDGWTSAQVGGQNTTTGGGATQLTKEAKWANDERTIADVQIKASFAAERQMDFIFVADCSNSMAGFGSSDAMNSNFYNMQSKLLDVTEKLLSSGDLDTRVAFVTFGEKDTDLAYSKFFGKEEKDAAQKHIWNEIVNYQSNTNYGYGLEKALDLVEGNTGRNTTVIFISDGQPYYDGTVENIPPEYYGAEPAKAIRDAGAEIIAVLQQVPASELESSEANMKKLTSEDKIFSSTDLNGFSTAVNNAIDYAYHNYTLTDTVHPDFLLDKESLKVQKLVDGALVDAPEVTAAASGNVITWNLGAGDPFTTYILTFQQTLKPENQHEGDFDTNAGDAPLTIGGKAVNNVATPVLPRPGSSNPGSGGGDDPDYDDITVTKVDEDGNTITRVASFIVYKKSGGDILYKTVSGKWTEDRDEAWKYYTRDGKFTVYDLKPGTYYIEEIKAPDGYQKAEEPLKVEVDGRDVKVQFENETAQKPTTPKPIPDTGR